MPEQKKSYRERIRLAAQKHADKWNEGVVYSEDFKKDLQPEWSNEDCIKDGKVTVAMQAEAIREYANAMYIHDTPENIETWLLEHGYIEPKQSFHCNNKGRHYSDPGYKPVCEKQCASCSAEYPQDGIYIEPKTEDDGAHNKER